MLNPVYKIVSESVNLQESDLRQGVKAARKYFGSSGHAAGELLHAAGDNAEAIGKFYGTAVKTLEKEVPGIERLWAVIKGRAAKIAARTNAANEANAAEFIKTLKANGNRVDSAVSKHMNLASKFGFN